MCTSMSNLTALRNISLLLGETTRRRGLRQCSEMTQGEHESERNDPGRNTTGTGKWAKRPGRERENGLKLP